jgi:CheY-like chemotaxis protein
MGKNQFAILDPDGTVLEATDETARLCGIPNENLVGHSFSRHLIAEHRIRFEAELEALKEKSEHHGRVHCTVIGADAIGRRLTILLSGMDDKFSLSLSSYQHAGPIQKAPGSLLLETGRLLPIARRISAIARRATDKEKLMRAGLEVLAEVTSATSGTALNWRDRGVNQTVISIGEFDQNHLRGVFRPSVLARLTRGDVVIKESSMEGSASDTCLLILPLLASTAPVGIMVLSIDGYSVLVPEEQQSLIILGEIIGLGLKALTTTSSHHGESLGHSGDIEGTVALGRLSAGLTHEINNAATILRNNIEQFALSSDGFGRGNISDSAIKDSLNALDAVTDLTEALRAFAPEETSLQEEVDLLRVIDSVNRTVRFYAKRGIRVTLERPKSDPPLVFAHPHYLIRSLFLIFVELVEASIESAIDLDVHLTLDTEDNVVTLSINVTAGPFSLPQILLSQLEKGGVLVRHVSKGGGELAHTVDHQGNLIMSIALSVATAPSSKSNPPTTGISQPPRRGKILICEDDVAVIRSMRRLLERRHDVLAARSGREALRIIESNSDIDLVMYDAAMPDLIAPAFWEEVLRLNQPLTNRIVFSGGGSYDPEIAEFMNSNDTTIVEKPFNLSLLNDIILSHLN